MVRFDWEILFLEKKRRGVMRGELFEYGAKACAS